MRWIFACLLLLTTCCASAPGRLSVDVDPEGFPSGCKLLSINKIEMKHPYYEPGAYGFVRTKQWVYECRGSLAKTFGLPTRPAGK
jgi:hypothetical protein